MLRSRLKLVGSGEDSLLCVYGPPVEAIPDDAPGSCMAIPVLLRESGILLAIPADYVLPHTLTDAAIVSDEDALFGPSKEFTAPLLEEDEQGNEFATGLEARFLVVDLSNEALESLREYDPVIDPSAVIQPFYTDRPGAIVDVSSSMQSITTWLESVGGRSNFLSAREEPEEPTVKPPATKKAGAKKLTTATLAQQVAGLATQMQALAAQQELLLQMQENQQKAIGMTADPPGPKVGLPVTTRLPSVSAGVVRPGNPSVVPKVAQLLGPPPRTRATEITRAPELIQDTGELLEDMQPTEGHSVSKAIMMQSAALTSLVAHLTSGDPLSELTASTSSGSSLSTRGVARREKLQQELASGSSNFFLQVQQQLFKKMFPARPLPRTESELIGSGISLTGYLERFGGYRNKPDAAMTMWMLGHAMDAAAQGDNHLVREYLALTTACVEQASMDGNWSLAWVMSLLEEPPIQVMADRSVSLSSLGRPFSPLVPPTWTAITLSYIKEMDILATRKNDAKAAKAATPKLTDPAPQAPSPKRPRFPRKPKAEQPPKAAAN